MPEQSPTWVRCEELREGSNATYRLTFEVKEALQPGQYIVWLAAKDGKDDQGNYDERHDWTVTEERDGSPVKPGMVYPDRRMVYSGALKQDQRR